MDNDEQNQPSFKDVLHWLFVDVILAGFIVLTQVAMFMFTMYLVLVPALWLWNSFIPAIFGG